MSEEKKAVDRPKVNSKAQNDLDKAQASFDQFNDEVKDLTLDRMNMAPKLEVEAQTNFGQKDIDKSKDIYLKPKRALPPGVNPKTGAREQFNEKFRPEFTFATEYVQFVAENKEIIGETIDLWTKPFPGMNCENWEVPTNKPVWGPRHLAERLTKCSYHRLTMTDRPSAQTGDMTFYGVMAVDNIVQRLDARPVTSRKSVFMGSASF